MERFQELPEAQAQELKLEDLIVRLRIEEDNRKSEKRSSKNSYEAKANVIEDSNGKASTSKGLKRRRLPKGTKARSKKARTCASREPTTSAIKRGHKANECRSRLKKNKKNHPQASLTDHASPNLSVAVSEVNLTTNNKD